MYEGQDTFGTPCELPVGANILDLLCTYMIKDDGRLKARCVCNGQPSNKNKLVIGYAFTKILDHVGSRIFWAACAANMLVMPLLKLMLQKFHSMSELILLLS